MARHKIHLGVNIDHAATLRQVRAGTTPYPDILNIAKLSLAAGASQITIHLREDRRHIQLQDLVQLSKDPQIPLNLEMALTDEMRLLALKYKPEWVCLVPEKRKELTTEGGLDAFKNLKKAQEFTKQFHKKGIKVSLFIGANFKQINAAHDIGADAVEFHTGHWVHAKGKDRQRQWQELCEGAVFADELGLRVHAGHGIDFESAKEITQLPFLREVNIGHSLICYSLEMGLGSAIKKMLKQLR